MKGKAFRKYGKIKKGKFQDDICGMIFLYHVRDIVQNEIVVSFILKKIFHITNLYPGRGAVAKEFPTNYRIAPEEQGEDSACTCPS